MIVLTTRLKYNDSAANAPAREPFLLPQASSNATHQRPERRNRTHRRPDPPPAKDALDPPDGPEAIELDPPQAAAQTMAHAAQRTQRARVMGTTLLYAEALVKARPA